MAPFIVEDVRKALESIGDLKAPGLDGMPAIFYKRFWGTVGETVVQEVLDVLQGGELPEITHKVQKKLTKSFTQSMDYIHGVCAEYTGDGRKKTEASTHCISLPSTYSFAPFYFGHLTLSKLHLSPTSNTPPQDGANASYSPILPHRLENIFSGKPLVGTSAS